MTIQQLKSFLAVCEEMNYSRAAHKYYISRQALRQNITALEEELCGALFVNHANRISLTSKGLKLYNESRQVVAAFDELEESMLSEIKRTSELSVGVSYALVPDYLPSLSEHLELFSRQHRSIELKIFYLNNDDIAPMIASGKLDCGIVMDLGTAAENVDRAELSSHPAYVIFPSGSKYSGYDSVGVQELRDEKICLPGVGEEMRPLCAAEGIDPILVPSYYQALYFVRENGYCAITRPIEESAHLKPFVSVVPMKGYTIHSSCITAKGNERHALKQLSAFLKSEIGKIFA